jgi:arginase family enzyme
MPDSLHIADFLEPIQPAVISNDEPFHDGQIGKTITIYESEFPNLKEADVILVACGDQRGSHPFRQNAAVDNIRQEFYKLYNWYEPLKIVDIGNVKTGASLNDTCAALRTIVKEISALNKSLVILGGSHDLTLAQYYAYADTGKLIEAVCIDAKIDLDMNSPAKCDNFLMDMLTGEPNFIRHYNHIGFQSYFVHPHMLETLDKLRFDCFRLGKVRENMDEIEPAIRNADLFSFDINAIAHAWCPSNELSPNGFTGDEACSLMRYAGMGHNNCSVGIYGYDAAQDPLHITARQISQMLWYYLEGKSRGVREAVIHDRDGFNEYHTAFAEVATTFLQSKRTGRWWMQLPDQQYIACSYNDYLLASSNEIPERWLRAQERSA